MSNTEVSAQPPGRTAPTDADLSSVTAERVAKLVDASPGLLAGPCAQLRRAALQVAVAGLMAADPGAATSRQVNYVPATNTVRVGTREYQLTPTSRIWVLGAGKASYPIAAALEAIFGRRIAGGVVAVRDPDLVALSHIEVIHADHPLPSERSIEAAKRILAMAQNAGSEDLVLACFTGGSSALASLPAEGVSATDKRTLHQLLLSSGLAIDEINAVRKSVSKVKGGRVALAAAPATVVNLTVSDVAGSQLDVVTDPTVQDSATSAKAKSVLSSSKLWDKIPSSVRAHLEADLPTPTLANEPQTVMLADGASTVAAMADAAQSLGFRPVVVTEEVEGAADEVGPRLAHRLISKLTEGHTQPVMLLGCGGESVVTVDSPEAFSQGGPNQHAALSAASALRNHRAAALFLDTDGSDGGTELAGGLVDGSTMDLAEARGVDVLSGLAAQRSSAVCKALNAAVSTGHTGTNVNDLFVLVAESGELS
ncbi:MAG TPA: DUF4147 domain-containing protein [Actinomycetes bacterium]|nr:DUF4147 domain-containing protein [Actinomycetes bacterium]